MALELPTPFATVPNAGSSLALNRSYPSCDPIPGSTGGESREDPVGNDEGKSWWFVQGTTNTLYIADTSSTTHPDNHDNTDNTATAETTDTSHPADATVIAHEMDAEDETDAADLIDADIYEQLTQNINNSMAYPERGHSVEVLSSASAQLHSVTP
jgi:hypothetical protein